jgi:hypothetical protein
MATDTVPLFNANDRLTGRDGGPYMDLEQAKQQEVNRAKVEGREPDLENPPAFAGIQLNTAGQQEATIGVSGIHSQESRNVTNPDVTFKGSVESEDTLLKPFSERESFDDVDNGPVFGSTSAVMDTNPAAIGTGPFAAGEGEPNAGPVADKVSDGANATQKSAAKKASTARKTASSTRKPGDASDSPAAKKRTAKQTVKSTADRVNQGSGK